MSLLWFFLKSRIYVCIKGKKKKKRRPVEHGLSLTFMDCAPWGLLTDNAYDDYRPK